MQPVPLRDESSKLVNSSLGLHETNLLLSLYRKNNTDGKLWGSQRIEFFMDQQSLVATSNRTSLVNNEW